jgi:hypothetical protein
MKTNLFYIFIFLFLFVSCKKTNKEQIDQNNIEIYLPKKRIESYEGVYYKDIIKDTALLKQLKYRLRGDLLRIDTTNLKDLDTLKIPLNKYIFAGHYNVKNNDLEKTPFITNDEIIGFNLKNSEIILSNSAAKKLNKFHPMSHFGEQFIITVNKRPVLNGYLYNFVYSYYVNTFHIPYIQYSEELLKDKKEGHIFSLKYGQDIQTPNLKENLILYNAFKESNRVVK